MGFSVSGGRDFFMANDDTQLKYFMELGIFVHTYSKVEAFVHLMFPRIAKVQPSVANAIKRSMKVSELISIIKPLLVLNDYSSEVILESEKLFSHFAHISEFRHKIIHRGADLLEDGSLFSHNSPTMGLAERFETMKFSVEDIEHASEDLRRMQLRILLLGSGCSRELILQNDQNAFAPWLYTHVQPMTPNQRLPAKTPARQRPQKP